MNRLRNSEHLKFPVGNGNKKKAKSKLAPRQVGRTLQSWLQSRQDLECRSSGDRKQMHHWICKGTSFWSYSDDRVFMKNYFRITRTFPGHIWLLLVRKAPGGQSTLLCAVLLLQDTQNKTSLFREKVSKLVKLCKKKKKTHSEIPASRQKVANDFSQCPPPRPILTHPPRPPLVRECEECNDANAQ